MTTESKLLEEKRKLTRSRVRPILTDQKIGERVTRKNRTGTGTEGRFVWGIRPSLIKLVERFFLRDK